MIRTLAALIEKFVEVEKEVLSTYLFVDHPTMIGDMYEELTKEVFEKILIPDLDLRVVSGKIRLPDNTLSSQTDCMLVIGEGERLPRTRHYIYDKANVIVTVEIKKNLFTNEIEDAIGKLNSIKPDELPDEEIVQPYHEEMIYEAFCSTLYGVTRKSDLNEYTPTQRYAYYNIMIDAFNPLQIVFAYDGLKTEDSLRLSINKLVDKSIGKSGFQPCNFPDMVICGKNSLLKCNGMPFGNPIMIDDTWPFYASNNSNPVSALIDMIWYRLMKRFNLGYGVFNDRLVEEGMHILLGARFVKTDTMQGWQMIDFPSAFSARDFYANPNDPVELNEMEYEIVKRLLTEKSIHSFQIDGLNDYLRANNIILSAFIQQLRHKGIIEMKNGFIYLTNVEHIFIKYKDGKYYAMEKGQAYDYRWFLDVES